MFNQRNLPRFVLLLILFGALFYFLIDRAVSDDLPEKSIQTIKSDNTGYLFIIGGGSRPPAMIDSLIQVSKVSEGYGIILPMASSEPDSAFYYANRQFLERGIDMVNVDLSKKELTQALIDSLIQADLIYMAGGDQRKLMQHLSKRARQAIEKNYNSGGVIAGTSAGAAVMSHKMITGDEKKHPEYTPTFKTIEADNIIYDEGLGLLPDNIIIDQHFIYRSRYNRLLTAILEEDGLTGIGIDESTAILVHNDSATVVGDWQVVSFTKNSTAKLVDGKLGAKNIELNIYLPGETFILPK